MCAHDPLPRDRTYAEPRLPRWPCAHSGFDTPQQVTAVAAEPFPNVRRVGAVCRQQSAREQSAPRVGIQSPLRIDHRAFSSVIRPWPLSFAAPKYAISDVQYLMRGRPVHSTVWCRDTLGWSLDKHRRNGISFQQPCFGHSPNILNCHSGRDLAQNQAFCSWLDYCKFGDNQVHSAHRS